MEYYDNLKLAKVVLGKAYDSLISLTSFQDSIVGKALHEISKEKVEYEKDLLMKTFFSNLGYSYENPEFLYHYTSLDVLQKVVENEDIYLFDSLTSNDLYEKKHGSDILSDLLNEKLLGKCLTSPELLENNQNRVINELKLTILEKDLLAFDGIDDDKIYRELYFATHIINHVDTYITCFSNPENYKTYYQEDILPQDNLPMWRFYGNGQGACLKFNTYGLKSLLEENIALLFPIIYDPEHCKFFYKSIYKIMHDFIGSDSDQLDVYGLSHMNKNQIIITLSMTLQIAANLMKHPSFKEENEWRILVPYFEERIFNKNVNYLNVHGRDRAYINIKNYTKDQNILKNVLSEVMYGPTCLEKELHDCFSLLKPKLDDINCNITNSKLPFNS